MRVDESERGTGQTEKAGVCSYALGCNGEGSVWGVGWGCKEGAKEREEEGKGETLQE